MSKHFKESEFKCKCCGVVKISPLLILILEEVRKDYGYPMHVNSGYRCPKHNAEVGGGPEHPRGLAADIGVNSWEDVYQLVGAAMRASIPRIGVSAKTGSFFVHLGIDTTLPQMAMWTY